MNISTRILFTGIILFLLLWRGFGVEVIAQPAFDWAKKIGGTGSDDGWGMALDDAGNIYSTGYFSGAVDFDPSDTGEYIMTTNLGQFGDYNATAFICKLDSGGNFVWAKQMAGTDKYAYSYGRAIAIDKKGNVYTTGYFSNGSVDFDPDTANTYILPIAGSENAFISKLDASGNFVWAKSFGEGDIWDRSYGEDIEVDNEGNVYTIGGFEGTVDFNPGADTVSLTYYLYPTDVFISKLDSAGNFIWAKQFNRAQGKNGDDGLCMALDENANIYAAGCFGISIDLDPGQGKQQLRATGSEEDIFVNKLDASGNFIWGKQISGKGEDIAYSIALDTLGNAYITGVFSDTIDADPSSSGIYNLASSGFEDIFAIKLSADGNFVWAKSMGGSEYDGGDAIYVDNKGNVYVAGATSGTADFDPGPEIHNLTAAGSLDVFFTKLNSDGYFIYAALMGGVDGDYGHAIIVNDKEEVYFTGHFNDAGFGGNASGEADFDPSDSVYTLIADGNREIFESKLSKGICPLPQKPLVTASGPLVFCFNDSVVLNTDSGLMRYQWLPTNDSEQATLVKKSGAYSVVVANACGTDTSSVLVIKVNPSPVPELSPSVTIFSGKSTILSASGGNTYVWSPGEELDCTTCSKAVATPFHTTTYIMAMTDINNCTAIDSVRIFVVEPVEIILPNVFSPNADGINDVFNLSSTGLNGFSCLIYNRWGNKIYEWNEPGRGWDGKATNGEECIEGVYFFLLKASQQNGDLIEEKGYVQLVRNKR